MRRNARSRWTLLCLFAITLTLLAIASAAGCSVEVDGPTPRVAAAVNPAVACNASNAENAGVRTIVRLTSPDGTFSPLPVDVLNKGSIKLPRVFLLAGGAEREIVNVRFIDQKTLEVVVSTLDPPLAAGTYEFIVQNPNGHRSQAAGKLVIVDPPVVKTVSAQSQQFNNGTAQICTTIDNLLTIVGTGFRPDDDPPVVEILACADPTDFKTCISEACSADADCKSPAPVCGPSGYCAVAVIDDAKVVDETTMEATLKGGMTELPPGTYGLRVTNPEKPGCTGTLTTALIVVPAPTITDFQPPTVCGMNAQVSITGTGFHGNMTAGVGGAPITNVMVPSDTSLTGTAPNTLADGTYDATVTTPEGCTATFPGVKVLASVNATIDSVFPQKGWLGIDNPVQVFGSGFVAGDTLFLRGAATGGGNLALVDLVIDPTGTRIDATVPKGGVAGVYDLVLQTPEGCQIVLPMAFTILANPSLTIDEIIPPFGWTMARTPVTIIGSGFISTPKAYLVIPSLTPTLVALRGTGFVSDTSLNSIVQAGLPVGGPYDVVVINPDGGGGLKPAAFRVTSLPPPTIDNVTPGAGTTQNPTTLTITGCNFRTTALVDAVAIDKTLTSAMVTAQPTCNGPPGCAGNTNHCTMTATLNTGTMAVAPYVIRVTNTDEMTWGDWSVFVVTQPSAKLDNWAIAPTPLVTGRQAHAGLAGRINNASRFLYAIGGNTGTGGMVLDSVEVIPLDIFGQLGKPFQQRNNLTVRRSHVTAVQLGGYVYVIGGTTDLTTPLATIERAKILDDTDAPVVHDPSVLAGALGSGAWYYRVSAVKPSNDPDNPDGESLPSDEVISSLAKGGGITITWDPVPNAVAYRIYRTELANGTSQTEVFLEEVPAPTTTYTDDGTAVADPTRTPLARGSTGVWVVLSGTLVRPRFDHQAVIGHDPAGNAFVYAVGGTGNCTGGANTEMNCLELTSITSDGKTLGAWTAGVQPLTSPRSSFGLAIAENANSSDVPVGTAFLYASGGVNATTELEAAAITAGGQPSLFGQLCTNCSAPDIKSAKPGFVNGFGLQVINNAMYLNGGVAGKAPAGAPLVSTTFSKQFDAQGGPPAWDSFSSSSVSLLTPRYRHALVLESGYFYAIGGATDGALSNASASIEATIY